MAEKKSFSKRITVGHDPESGKAIRVRVRGSTKTEYDRNAYLARRAAELKTTRPQVLFKNYAKRWVELYKTQVEQKTCDMYWEAFL